MEEGKKRSPLASKIYLKIPGISKKCRGSVAYSFQSMRSPLIKKEE
jgi:hypothetical protein